MSKILVSGKHSYVLNLEKSHDRYLSGFILATKEVNKMSSWQMIKELCLTIVIQNQPAKSPILVRNRDVDWNKRDGKFNMGKLPFLFRVKIIQVSSKKVLPWVWFFHYLCKLFPRKNPLWIIRVLLRCLILNCAWINFTWLFSIDIFSNCSKRI